MSHRGAQRDDTIRPVPAGKTVAAFDSASAFLSSLSRALSHRDFPHLGQSRLKVPLVYASQLLPTRLRRRVYAVASGREGVTPDRLSGIDMDAVASWVTAHYRRDSVPAVLLGSSNGAITHLAAACAIPWLPQTLLIPVRRPGSDPDDVEAAADFGARHAPKLLETNPGIELHHMHDANQDALSASQMAYFRVKWSHLPTAYRQFMADRLAPGAPIIVVRDLSTWPVTRVADRHVFQVGAQGGMAPEEYLRAPGVPRADEVTAEAEWGFAEALLDPVRDWAKKHAHPVIEIQFDHPQAPAAGVADTFRPWLRSRGEAGERLLVSSFIVHDPWRTLTTASVPYWTFFPVRRAAQDLDEYLDTATYDDIDIMLFSHGVRSRGLAEAETWERLAGRALHLGRLLGVDAEAFPADFTAFARYAKALRTLPPSTRPLTRMPLEQALADLSTARGITVHQEHR